MPATTRQIARMSFALLALVFGSSAALGQAPQTMSTLTPAQETQVHDLAVRVLKHADTANCKKNSCTILVTNFSGPTGSTSALGIRLADELSDQLRSLATGVQIGARGFFMEFLAHERIPTKLLADHNAARWLAMQMSASAVVVGTLTEERTALHLTVRLLDAHKLEKQNDETVNKEENTREETNFSDLGDSLDLSPIEQLGESGQYPYGVEVSSHKGEFLRAGRDGVGVPSCSNGPGPGFTEEARIAHASGTVVVEVLVTPEGQIIEPRIVRGMPFGLNNAVLSTLTRWRCDPVKKEGVPVTVLVPVEISFRLF